MPTREILALVVLVGVVWVVLRIVRKDVRRYRDTSRSLERDDELKGKEARARATVVGVRENGFSSFNLVVDFQIEALDGTEKFTGQKTLKMMENKPAIGSVWPAWYDEADTTRFAVEVSDGLSQDQVSLYREFGIPHPLDNR